MSDLDDLFRQLAEAKAQDPIYKKEKKLQDTIKESVKSDLGGLFSQISAVKAEDPNVKKSKHLEKEIKESVKTDLGSLFAELSSLKKQKAELVEQNPELAEAVEEPIEEIIEQPISEVIAEDIPLPTPVGVVPSEAQLPEIEKYIKAAQEQDSSLYMKEFKTVNGKIKFLEQWIAKIQNAGPGGGEVNFRYLDDIDQSTIMDGNFLTYNSDTKKFEFREVVGGSGGVAQVQSDWTETNTASKAYIKHKPTLFSGSYTDLTDVPAMFGGSYNSLTDKPTLFSGSYTDLTNKPTLFSGVYADLTGKPTLFSGVYADLTGKPTLFSGSYIDLTNKPTLFSGSYTDLTDKPSIPSLSGYATETYVSTAINNLINGAPSTLDTLKEIADKLASEESAISAITSSFVSNASLVLTLGDYASKSYVTAQGYMKPTDSYSYNNLIDKPTLFSGSYIDLTNKPTLFSGAYADLTGKPTLFSGSYTDLTNKPTIPSLTGYATETFVTSQGYITTTDHLTANGRSVTLNSVGQTVLPVTTQGGITNAGWLTASGSVVLNANGSIWLFGQDGTMNSPYNVKITTTGIQFPDSSTQTTAWTGTAAAGTLTGTGLNSTVVNSNLQSVGQLSNLQVSGGASVTNNSSTNHYVNWGTVGQIFDDGQFHIHAKTGNVWINALDSSDIRLGTQYNSGSGSNVYVGNDLVSKTAYKARTNWNAALNTEIALDNYRYRVTSSGGIFPQIISNISGQTVNSSWVSVATISGTSITQTGNTGALLPNNSWTNLYSNHGLDSPADMVVATVTDKAHGIVHRVTFIRNDDGANTGYSIFVEKLW